MIGLEGHVEGGSGGWLIGKRVGRGWLVDGLEGHVKGGSGGWLIGKWVGGLVG